MANILTFSRNRCTSVEQIDQETLRSSCRLQDTLMEARVQLLVKLPDLEILEAEGEVRRSYQEECFDSTDLLKGVIGVRIGPGVLKIIKGLIGKATKCKQLAFMVEECCHGVILSYTKDAVLLAPKDLAEKKDYYARMVKENVRLYNRCAAFAPGSSLVEGIDPP